MRDYSAVCACVRRVREDSSEGACVRDRMQCVRGTRLYLGLSCQGQPYNRRAAAKALRFQLCAVIIRCIFSVGCCRFFVLARSGAFG